MERIPFYLASASPRRLQLLRSVGIEPRVVAVDVPELPRAGESPADLVCRLAADKGRAAFARTPATEPGVLLAADTAVLLDGEVLGKPVDAGDAVRMLRRLSGRAHEVLTGVFVARTADARSIGECRATRVRFRRCDEATLRAYVATGEPLDKAGAYGIQGRGALLVAGIEGSWANVAGLPVERLPAWLERLEIAIDRVVDWRA